MAAHLKITGVSCLPGHFPYKTGWSEEDSHEGLLLRPSSDQKVLAHLHFQSRVPPSDSRHHHLFPKSMSQLAQKFHVKEVEMSFTQERWNYEHCGGIDPVSTNNAKPPGWMSSVLGVLRKPD